VYPVFETRQAWQSVTAVVSLECARERKELDVHDI